MAYLTDLYFELVDAGIIPDILDEDYEPEVIEPQVYIPVDMGTHTW